MCVWDASLCTAHGSCFVSRCEAGQVDGYGGGAHELETGNGMSNSRGALVAGEQGGNTGSSSSSSSIDRASISVVVVVVLTLK